MQKIFVALTFGLGFLIIYPDNIGALICYECAAHSMQHPNSSCLDSFNNKTAQGLQKTCSEGLVCVKIKETGSPAAFRDNTIRMCGYARKACESRKQGGDWKIEACGCDTDYCNSATGNIIIRILLVITGIVLVFKFNHINSLW